MATEIHWRLWTLIRPHGKEKMQWPSILPSAFQDKEVQEDVGGFEWVVHNAASFQRRSQTSAKK